MRFKAFPKKRALEPRLHHVVDCSKSGCQPPETQMADVQKHTNDAQWAKRFCHMQHDLTWLPCPTDSTKCKNNAVHHTTKILLLRIIIYDYGNQTIKLHLCDCICCTKLAECYRDPSVSWSGFSSSCSNAHYSCVTFVTRHNSTGSSRYICHHLFWPYLIWSWPWSLTFWPQNLIMCSYLYPSAPKM